MGQYRLRAGITTGRIESDDLGTFHIEHGELTVDDYDTASELVERFTAVDWPDEDPGSDEDDSDEDLDVSTQPVPDETADTSADEDDDDETEADAESGTDDECTESESEAEAEADEADADAESDDEDEAEDEDGELCGAIKSDGEPCDRLAAECPYH